MNTFAHYIIYTQFHYIKWGQFLSYSVEYAIISLVKLEYVGIVLWLLFPGTERGNAMSLDNVLTLLLVLFTALTYIDNRNNHKK